MQLSNPAPWVLNNNGDRAWSHNGDQTLWAFQFINANGLIPLFACTVSKAARLTEVERKEPRALERADTKSGPTLS